MGDRILPFTIALRLWAFLALLAGPGAFAGNLPSPGGPGCVLAKPDPKAQAAELSKALELELRQAQGGADVAPVRLEFAGTPTKVYDDVEKVIGKPLNTTQKKALDEAMSLQQGAAITEGNQMRQDKILADAGLDPRTLRGNNALGKTVVVPKALPNQAMIHDAPQAVEVSWAGLKKVVKELGEGKNYHLVVTEEGKLFLVPQRLETPENTFGFLRVSDGKGGQMNYAIRQHGQLSLSDPKTKRLVYRAAYGAESELLLDAENTLNELESKSGRPNVKVEKTASGGSSGGGNNRLIRCQEIVAKDNTQWRFVRDKILSENIVAVGAIGVLHATGVTNLYKPEDYAVAKSDLETTTPSAMVGGFVGHLLESNNVTRGSQMMIRTGVGLGMTQVNNKVYRYNARGTKEKGDAEVAKDVANFNTVHGLARVPVNYAMDEAVFKKLPDYMLQKCLKGEPVSILVSPMAIRIYERSISTVIYYGSRAAYIYGKKKEREGQGGKPKEPIAGNE